MVPGDTGTSPYLNICLTEYFVCVIKCQVFPGNPWYIMVVSVIKNNWDPNRMLLDILLYLDKVSYNLLFLKFNRSRNEVSSELIRCLIVRLHNFSNLFIQVQVS